MVEPRGGEGTVRSGLRRERAAVPRSVRVYADAVQERLRVGEVVDYHEPFQPAHRIRPARILAVNALSAGAFTYTVELDDGTRMYPFPTTVHRPGECADCRWCTEKGSGADIVPGDEPSTTAVEAESRPGT